LLIITTQSFSPAYQPKVYILAKNPIFLKYADSLSFFLKKYVVKKKIPKADLDISQRRSYLNVSIKEI